MIRSLALASSYPMHPDEGTAPFIRYISHGLIEHGVGVDIVLPDHPDLDWLDGDSPVGLHKHRYLPRSAPSAWHVWGYGASLVADRRLRMSTLAVLPAAAVSATTRFLRLGRSIQPQVLHAHWLLPAGPIVALSARLIGHPYVVSLHGSGAFLAERSTVMRAAARFALRGASGVTACSGDLGRRAIHLGASPEAVSVIPYGVDTEAFRPKRDEVRARVRAELDINDDRVMVLAVGRLVAKKGFGHLIEAAAGVNDVELVVAGGGDLEGELRASITALGLVSRARLLGRVSHEYVRDLYAAADILAVPSVVDASGNVDGLPNVILEGMASGLPIVASRVAGIPDVIRHRENGLLVPAADVTSLRGALVELVSNRTLREGLGSAARADAVEHLRWSTVTGRYAEVLSQAAAGGP